MDKVAGWVQDGWIYSKNTEVSGRFRIVDDWIWDEHRRGEGRPRYWISNGHIYGPVGSNNLITGYQIKNGWLFGPSLKLPFAD